MISQPVCCPETGNEYGNECMALCNDATKFEEGRCSDVIGKCTADYAPLCCDGQTFPNECTALYEGVTDIDSCEDGRCLVLY